MKYLFPLMLSLLLYWHFPRPVNPTQPNLDGQQLKAFLVAQKGFLEDDPIFNARQKDLANYRIVFKNQGKNYVFSFLPVRSPDGMNSMGAIKPNGMYGDVYIDRVTLKHVKTLIPQ